MSTKVFNLASDGMQAARITIGRNRLNSIGPFCRIEYVNERTEIMIAYVIEREAQVTRLYFLLSSVVSKPWFKHLCCPDRKPMSQT